MIKSFRHNGLRAFYENGSKAGIQPHHAKRLSSQLAALDLAKSASDMNRPGWFMHPLKGDRSDLFSVEVSGNWRMTFAFDNGDAVLIDYQDYH